MAELPQPEKFCVKPKSVSPNGKLGLHVITYKGNLPQDNTYVDTWEEFFIKGFKQMISLNIARGRPWVELRGLDTVMAEKVMPQITATYGESRMVY